VNTASVTIETLSHLECLRLLATAPFGRICYTSGAMPTVQPVNFAVAGQQLVMRTSSVSKLVAASRNAVCAFEADDIDPATLAGWSVVVIGRANAVTDLETVERLGQLALRSWATPDSERFITLELDLVSGRWLHSPA
jgi:nitroimidazol reductase NimA-like FMN-containing flavoprotein (pyridoxamine 5'-phosphate oxidase superfamily)